MSKLASFRDASIRRVSWSTRQALANRWDEAEHRLPDDEMPLACTWVSEAPDWNGVIPVGDSFWFGDLLLTPKRFVKINADGVSQIRLSDLDGSSYHEFKVGLFKRYCHLLLTLQGRPVHVFSLGTNALAARKYGELVRSVVSSLQPDTFD